MENNNKLINRMHYEYGKALRVANYSVPCAYNTLMEDDALSEHDVIKSYTRLTRNINE